MLHTWRLWYFLAKTIFHVQSFVNCPNPCLLLSFLHQEASITSKDLNNFKTWQLLCSRCSARIISYGYRCNKSSINDFGHVLPKTTGHWSFLHNIFSHISHVMHFNIIFYIHFHHTLVLWILKPHHTPYSYFCILVFSYGKTSNI